MNERKVAINTLKKMSIPEQQVILGAATSVEKATGLPFQDCLVVIMKLGRYVATHTGVIKND